MGILFVGVLIGLDNLAVASGLGLLGLSRERRAWFIASCVACESLAPIVGLGMGHGLQAWLSPAAEWTGSVALALSGALVLNAVARRHAYRGLLDRPAMLVLLPLALSLDNLSAGVGLGGFGAEIALAAVIGGISGVLSVFGFLFGESLSLRIPRFAGPLAGAWFLACAVVSRLVDLG